MVLLALFNSKVPVDERFALADQLLPVKPEMDLELPQSLVQDSAN